MTIILGCGAAIIQAVAISWSNTICAVCCSQGLPEKSRGPGQRVKVGPQGQGGSILNHNFTQAVS